MTRNSGSLVHSTPPPAFAVTLSQDILRGLGHPVRVVLEEADTVCARRTAEIAKEHTCYLLSLDSDLHCFDLGREGYYLPLDSILCSELAVTGRIYNYARTQQSLGVNLVELATLMGAEGSTDIARSAPEALRALKTGRLIDHVDAAEISRVAEQFSITQSCIEDNLEAALSIAIVDNLHSGRLYGRLAEVVQGGEMWLPQLLEDYTQASAWNIGLSYRTAAYKILVDLGALSNSDGRVSEWVRRADRVTLRQIVLEDECEPTIGMSRLDVRDVATEAMNALIRAAQQDGKALSKTEYEAFLVMLVTTLSSDISTMTVRMLQLTSRYQAIIFSVTLLIQVRTAAQSWPNHAQLFDMPTLLGAFEALQNGSTLSDLTRGHETEIARLQSAIQWTSRRSAKKARRRRDVD